MKPFSFNLLDTIKGKDLRHNYNGWLDIDKNYSECLQDVFVMMAHDGKKNGTYIEVGCDKPYFRSNTALLQDNGWKGISIDLNDAAVKDWNEQRGYHVVEGAPIGGLNRAYSVDATTINWEHYMPQHAMPVWVDYLQLDCDPPDVSFKAMLQIPWDSYQFGVITYEHDWYYYDDQDFRVSSRKFLAERGYVLAARNISPDEDRSRAYEDWWVHPTIIDPVILPKLICESDSNKTPMEYLTGEV